MDKLDPYKHQQLYENWKKNPDNPNISSKNNKLLQQYLSDMEMGKNISRVSKKGSRSYTRLNHLRQKISFLMELLEKKRGVKDSTKSTEDDVHFIFNGMEKGSIRKLDGGRYTSVNDYVRLFKSFWHWYQLINQKKGVNIQDITLELDSRADKEPEFVYFTENQLNEMIKFADEDMKVIMLFLFDSGMRVTEMVNLKVSDFLNDFKEVNIRKETSKTFGRRFKLMMSSDVVKNYVKVLGLEKDNFVFRLTPDQMNVRLKPLGKKVLRVDNLTLYDFRHSSACYWYPRYPKVQGLLYRFGWKKLEMVHYYARFLGMEDTISEEDLLLGVTKTELEKKLADLERKFNNFIDSGEETDLHKEYQKHKLGLKTRQQFEEALENNPNVEKIN